MKINYTEDGLEDLTGYMYNYKSNTFTKDGDEYKFIMACVFCGQAFMSELDGTYQFCDRNCRGAFIFYHSISHMLF